MAFLEVKNKRGNNGGGSQRNKEYDVLSCSKAGLYKSKNKEFQVYNVSITISENSMKSARLIIGDRVKVFVDNEAKNRLFIKRVTEGGYMISCGEPIKNKGKSIRGYLKIGLDPLIEINQGERLFAKAELAEGGLIFNFSPLF